MSHYDDAFNKFDSVNEIIWDTVRIKFGRSSELMCFPWLSFVSLLLLEAHISYPSYYINIIIRNTFNKYNMTDNLRMSLDKN